MKARILVHWYHFHCEEFDLDAGDNVTHKKEAVTCGKCLKNFKKKDKQRAKRQKLKEEQYGS